MLNGRWPHGLSAWNWVRDAIIIRDGRLTMLTNLPVPFDFCVGDPISRWETVGSLALAKCRPLVQAPPSTVIRDILWRALLCSASSAPGQLTRTKKLKIIRWQILTENITILLLPSLRLFLQVTFLESSAFTWLGSTPLDLAIFRSLVSIPSLFFV